MRRYFGFKILGLAAVCCGPVTANAAILNETYTYANGELGSVSGGNWTLFSGTGGQTVAGGVLAIDDNSTGDYSRPLGTAPVITSGIIYAGFDLTVSAADRPSSAASVDSYFAAFAEQATTLASTNFASRVVLNTGSGTTSSKIGIGRGSGTGATTTLFPTELTVGTTYRIVHAYDMDNDIATLWVNPVDVSSTSVTSNTGTTDPVALNFYLTRINTTSDGDKTFDNLVVSTSFAEVVPEPTGVSLLVAAAAAGLGRRRRRSFSVVA